MLLLLPLKRQSEHSGLRPDTSSLVMFQYAKYLCVANYTHSNSIQIELRQAYWSYHFHKKPPFFFHFCLTRLKFVVYQYFLD